MYCKYLKVTSDSSSTFGPASTPLHTSLYVYLDLAKCWCTPACIAQLQAYGLPRKCIMVFVILGIPKYKVMAAMYKEFAGSFFWAKLSHNIWCLCIVTLKCFEHQVWSLSIKAFTETQKTTVALGTLGWLSTATTFVRCATHSTTHTLYDLSHWAELVTIVPTTNSPSHNTPWEHALSIKSAHDLHSLVSQDHRYS